MISITSILAAILGVLVFLGLKKAKESVFPAKDPRDELAEAIVRNHEAVSQASSAKTQEEVHAALDALADADSK